MTGACILAQRARDPRPLSVGFPVSRNRETTMSDAHEILRRLEDMPRSLLSYESRPSVHILQGRTKAGLYEPDLVVELVQRDGFVDFEPEDLRNMVVRTLTQAFPEDGADLGPPVDQKALMTSLGSLATMRSLKQGSEEAVSTTFWAPTPWCDLGAHTSHRPVIPTAFRRKWSELVTPSITISDRTLSEATLSIVVRPDMSTTTVSCDPMERLRLERDMAPILAGLDDETAW